MKVFSALFLFLAITSFSYATTLEEIVQLSVLNTSDDLILQLIQKSPVKTFVGPADVVFLKQQGVSEQVISYIWASTKSEKAILPPQEGESISLGEGLRAYYVSTEDGQKKMVVTNLDENGMRMGPLPPLPSSEPVNTERMRQASAPVDYSGQYEIPREVYVTVRNDQPAEVPYNYQPTDYSNSNTYYPTGGTFSSFYAAPYVSYYSPYSFRPMMQFAHNSFYSHPSPFGRGHSFPFHKGNGFQNCPRPNVRTGQKSSRN